MDSLTFAQRDCPAQRFAIQAHLDAASLEPASLSQRTRKEVSQHLLELIRIHPTSQHAAPGTRMRHRLALQREQQTQFRLAQLRPMGYGATTILPCQLGQHTEKSRCWPMDSAVLGGSADRAPFADRDRAPLNQTATLRWEEEGWLKLLYLS